MKIKLILWSYKMGSIGKFITTVLIFCGLVCVGSCVKGDENATYQQQEDEIFEYVEFNRDSDCIEYDGGVWRIINQAGSGTDVVVRGSKVRIDYSLHIFSLSGGIGDPIMTNIGVAGVDGEWFTIGKKELLAGLDIGIVGAKLNEECEILFSARHGYGNKQIGVVKKMSPLLVHVKIKEIRND